jgi:hypothetical protein
MIGDHEKRNEIASDKEKVIVSFKRISKKMVDLGVSYRIISCSKLKMCKEIELDIIRQDIEGK